MFSVFICRQYPEKSGLPAALAPFGAAPASVIHACGRAWRSLHCMSLQDRASWVPITLLVLPIMSFSVPLRQYDTSLLHQVSAEWKELGRAIFRVFSYTLTCVRPPISLPCRKVETWPLYSTHCMASPCLQIEGRLSRAWRFSSRGMAASDPSGTPVKAPEYRGEHRGRLGERSDSLNKRRFMLKLTLNLVTLPQRSTHEISSPNIAVSFFLVLLPWMWEYAGRSRWTFQRSHALDHGPRHSIVCKYRHVGCKFDIC